VTLEARRADAQTCSATVVRGCVVDVLQRALGRRGRESLRVSRSSTPSAGDRLACGLPYVTSTPTSSGERRSPSQRISILVPPSGHEGRSPNDTYAQNPAMGDEFTQAGRSLPT
jgi:hypothetical protein